MGEEDLLWPNGEQHLCQQADQPDEEGEGDNLEVRKPHMRMQNGSWKRQLRNNKTGQKTPV